MFLLRGMNPGDLNQVYSIEALATDRTPAQVRDDIDALRANAQMRGVVAYDPTLQAEVVGFAFYEPTKTLDFELWLVRVQPRFQRRGVGRQLVQMLQRQLHKLSFNRIIARVRETDVTTQIFLRAVAFLCVRTEPHQYDDSTDDQYVFEHVLADRNMSSSILAGPARYERG